MRPILDESDMYIAKSLRDFKTKPLSSHVYFKPHAVAS